MLVIEGLVGLHRTVSFSFFSIADQGSDLDYCDVERFALETNRDHSASKYCISDSFLDYDGYSISSKGILAHSSRYNGHLISSHPFQSILVHLFLKCCSLLPSPV